MTITEKLKSYLDDVDSHLATACKDYFIKNILGEEDKAIISSFIGDLKIATVFGRSQVGKTTLIIETLGIKEEFKEQLELILRAGRPEGASSTSTAFLYQVSDASNFSLESNDLKIQKNNLSAEDAKKEIYNIRKKIENDKIIFQDIITILIPKNYVEHSDTSIKLVDIPGVESKDRYEYNNLNNLIHKYVIHSSIILVVENVNNITDIEKLRIPGIGSWTIFQRKAILVQTRGFTNESASIFFQEKSKDKISPIDIEEFFEKEILSRNRELRELFSEVRRVIVDVGNSFRSCNDEKFKKSIQLHNQETINYIRSEISKSFSESYSLIDKKMLLDRIVESHKGKINELNKEIYNLEGQIEFSENVLTKIQTDLNSLENDLKSRNDLIDCFGSIVEAVQNIKFFTSEKPQNKSLKDMNSYFDNSMEIFKKNLNDDLDNFLAKLVGYFVPVTLEDVNKSTKKILKKVGSFKISSEKFINETYNGIGDFFLGWFYDYNNENFEKCKKEIIDTFDVLINDIRSDLVDKILQPLEEENNSNIVKLEAQKKENTIHLTRLEKDLSEKKKERKKLNILLYREGEFFDKNKSTIEGLELFVGDFFINYPVKVYSENNKNDSLAKFIEFVILLNLKIKREYYMSDLNITEKEKEEFKTLLTSTLVDPLIKGLKKEIDEAVKSNNGNLSEESDRIIKKIKKNVDELDRLRDDFDHKNSISFEALVERVSLIHQVSVTSKDEFKLLNEQLNHLVASTKKNSDSIVHLENKIKSDLSFELDKISKIEEKFKSFDIVSIKTDIENQQNSFIKGMKYYLLKTVLITLLITVGSVFITLYFVQKYKLIQLLNLN